MSCEIDWGVAIQALAAVVQAVGSIWAIRTATRIANKQAQDTANRARAQADEAAELARQQFENAAKISRHEIAASDRRVRREQAERVAQARSRRLYVKAFFREYVDPLRAALVQDLEQAQKAISGETVDVHNYDTYKQVLDSARALKDFLEEMGQTFSQDPATALALYKLSKVADALSKGQGITGLPSEKQRIATAETKISQLDNALSHL